MLPTSAEFTIAANAVKRYPKARVDIVWTDPSVSEGNLISVSGSPAVSWHDPHLADGKKTTPHKWLVLDGSCDITTGDYWLAPGTADDAANNQFGWYSEEVCDSDGDFDAKPEATIEFASPRSLQQIIVTGEPTINQFPTDFDLYVTYGETPSEELIGNYAAAGPETVLDISLEAITDATKMRIVINKWSAGSTIAKIVEFFGTIADTFTQENIVSMDVLEEMETDTGTTPIGNMSCNELMLELPNISITRNDGTVVRNPFFPENTESYLRNALTPNVRIIPYLGFRLPDVYSASPEAIKTIESIQLNGTTDLIENYVVMYGKKIIDVSATIVNESGVSVSIESEVYYRYHCVLSFKKLAGTSGTFDVRIDGKPIVSQPVELVKMGEFFATDYEMSENDSVVKITARDRMEILRKNDYRQDVLPETATLYEVAEMILNSAKTNLMNDLEWNIDIALADITVPCPYLGNVKYFQALSKVAERCTGRCYQNRDGVIVIDGVGKDIYNGTSDITITRNQYFTQRRTFSDESIKNYVSVEYNTLTVAEEVGEIYTTKEITISEDVQSVVETVYLGDDPVLEAIATPVDQVGVTVILSSAMYPWGAVVTATKQSGTSGAFKIKIVGKRIAMTSSGKRTAQDDPSIRLYGKRPHDVQNNFLIQDETSAQNVANGMLATLLDNQRDITVDVPGNPSVEMGDTANIEVYHDLSASNNYRITRQHFKYDGTLSAQITGRKTLV